MKKLIILLLLCFNIYSYDILINVDALEDKNDQSFWLDDKEPIPQTENFIILNRKTTGFMLCKIINIGYVYQKKTYIIIQCKEIRK
jgi:hypothetical protein